MAMQLKLWGVRGSLPAPYTPEKLEEKIRSLLEDFSASNQSVDNFLASLPRTKIGGFGGHTACVQVTTPQKSLIVDGGSGIRRLGEQLACGPCGLGRGEVHILFTHFHWDHLIGLPFFIPIFIPGNKIHLYSVQEGLEEKIRHVFQKPFFPVPFERLGAEILFHHLEPRKPQKFNDVTVTPYLLDHPDPCWGYKFDHGGKSLSYCVDTECTRVSQKDLGEDLPLYQGVDLMVFDAQYTFLEATEKVDWGHASAPIGLDIAMREGIKRVLFVHHDPAASDEKIQTAEEQTRSYYEASIRMGKEQKREFSPVDWKFATEGLVVEI